MFRSTEETMRMLERKGYQVERLTKFQYRIECVFDLYVVNFKWHNIASGKRGSWHGLNDFHLCKLIDKHVAIADEILDAEIAAGRITPEGEPVIIPLGYGMPRGRRKEGDTSLVGKRDVDSPIWWSQKGLEKSRGETKR